MNFSMGPRSLLLFIAFLQGLIFAVLLLVRGQRKQQVHDVLLAGILFALATSLISYIIGFMGVYDMAREGGWDLSFFPFGNGFLYGPLILLYVRAVTDRAFHFNWTKEGLFLILPILYYARSLVLWSLPLSGKEAYYQYFNWEGIIWEVLVFVSTLPYLYAAWKRLIQYNQALDAEYSNTGTRTLNWLRAFLIAFSAYFAVDLVVHIIGLIFDFWYTDWYYLELTRACLLYYISVAGWGFSNKTDVPLQQIEQREAKQPEKTVGKPLFSPDDMDQKRKALLQFMQEKKPWLEADLTLSDLANKLQMTPVQLSALVNSGLGKNFNDFVNEYRVEAVKQRIAAGAAEQFSLLGIAYECGFNSKATFNRAFKKLTGTTPGEAATPSTSDN